MSEKTIFIIIYISSVFLSSVSQVVLKISAKKHYPTRIKEYINPYVIIAYSIFLSCTFITIYSLKVVPLTFAPILEASGYIFITLLSYFILKEKISRRKLIGILLIIIGILIYVLF